jgi:hypothetical protein
MQTLLILVLSGTVSTPASQTLFIVPTDAHYYKIIEMLKQFKKL